MATVTLILGNPALQIQSDDATTTFNTPRKGLEIKVRKHPDGSLVDFWARRGIASSDDLYWRFCDGMLSVSDNFRDAAAQVPWKNREVDSTALVDHFLFRTVPGERTYLRGLHRLGAGCQLSWGPGESPILRGPIPLQAEPSTNFCGDIERFLEEEIKSSTMDPITNMLSGGVDSALIQTFLGRDSTSISAAIDCPEYATEMDYALSAVELLGCRHHLVHVREASWLGDVVNTISVLGLPPHHLQTALIHRVFDAPFTRFMTGQYADALFGLSAASIKTPSPWMGSWLKRFIKNSLRGALSNPIREGQLQPLHHHPTNPASFAAKFGCYSDLDLMLRVFGSPQVHASLARRIDYTIERIGSDIPQGVDGQLHVGHWVDFYCDDTVSVWRQLGFGRGKELVAPFATAGAALTALSIPASHRYVSRGRVKYLLKDLLRERTHNYDVDKTKGNSSLPLYRFADDGLFESLESEYPTPPYLEEVSIALSSGAASQSFAETRWNLFTLAVWHHEILSNGHLRRHQSSRYFEV